MPKRTCSIDGCDEIHEARGWCRKHYVLWKLHGDPMLRGHTRIAPAEYLWARFRKTDAGCWEWTAGRSRGYGIATLPGTRRTVPAYRAMYELIVGPVPEGMELDHLCRNRSCVRPDHVEPVTRSVNQQRAAPFRWKTHCVNGHVMEGDNLVIKKNGSRRCRACHAAEQRERKRRLTKQKCGL